MSAAQLNLLPQLKKEFIRAQRTKRLIIISAVLVSGAFAGLVVLAIFYTLSQKLVISNAQSKIDSYAKTIQEEKDLDKILTVQNQMNALADLYKQKPAAERVFDFINTLTPGGVELHEFTLNFSENKITISGGAENIKRVNVFADTLKYARYKTGGSDQQDVKELDLPAAFSNVVFSELSVNDQAGNENSNETATFELAVNFDPTLFDISQTDLKLSVPNIESTVSATERPGGVFNDEFTPEESN